MAPARDGLSQSKPQPDPVAWLLPPRSPELRVHWRCLPFIAELISFAPAALKVLRGLGGIRADCELERQKGRLMGTSSPDAKPRARNRHVGGEERRLVGQAEAIVERQARQNR